MIESIYRGKLLWLDDTIYDGQILFLDRSEFWYRNGLCYREKSERLEWWRDGKCLTANKKWPAVPKYLKGKNDGKRNNNN